MVLIPKNSITPRITLSPDMIYCIYVIYSKFSKLKQKVLGIVCPLDDFYLSLLNVSISIFIEAGDIFLNMALVSFPERSESLKLLSIIFNMLSGCNSRIDLSNSRLNCDIVKLPASHSSRCIGRAGRSIYCSDILLR